MAIGKNDIRGLNALAFEPCSFDSKPRWLLLSRTPQESMHGLIEHWEVSVSKKSGVADPTQATCSG